MNDLHEQAALIMGGSTEVAGAVALALAGQGVRVCLCGKSIDLLELAAARITAAGGCCLTVVSALATLEQAQAVVAQARLVFGRLDILVLVSGFWSGGYVHEHAVRSWDLVMSANLREPFLMARAALPGLREQGHAELLAIGSDSALGIYPQDGAYAVAMHGFNALMELIRVENADCGLRVHVLSPGVALTPSQEETHKPGLTTSDVADWAVWLLTRPEHLRSNGPILL
jgi:3-oxoacyl-[acyl-carrier protein] reductase